MSLLDFCKERGTPELVKQWDRARNGALTPDEVSYGSKQKVWWVCERGHRWQAMVKARTGGSGCPVCANRTLAPGVNDLASLNPMLAKEWHPTKNGGLTPGQVLAGSRRRVWWQCSRGHGWQATICSRTQGAGCPVCAGKTVLAGENDLASLYPNLAKEWHRERNGALTPDQVAAYSNRRVWWQCAEGHSYQTPVCGRTARGTGCPYCAGRRVLAGFNDLASRAPEVAAQWHPTLNGGLTPDRVTVGANRRVWWQCAEGHSWRTMVYARTGGNHTGCPVCAGRHGGRGARYPRPQGRPAVGAEATVQGP